MNDEQLYYYVKGLMDSGLTPAEVGAKIREAVPATLTPPTFVPVPYEVPTTAPQLPPWQEFPCWYEGKPTWGGGFLGQNISYIAMREHFTPGAGVDSDARH